MSILSKFYFSDVGVLRGSHHFKRNAAAAAGISAGGSVLGSLIGGYFGLRGQYSANRSNQLIAQQTNAMNYKIASEANAAQLEQLAKNQMWQERMYEKDRDYNSMAAQMARARAAGINPYALAGNGAGVQGGTVPSSPSAGYTPVVAHMEPWRVENPFSHSNFGANFASFASGIADLLRAGFEKEKLQPSIDLMNSQSGLALQKIKESEVHQAYEDTINKINEQFGAKKASAEVREIQKRVDKLVADISVADATVDNINANTMVQQALERVHLTEGDLKKVQLEWLPKQLEENVNLTKEQRRTQKSIQSYNYAGAEQARANARYFLAQAKTEEEMRDLKTTAQRLENKIRAIDWEVNDQTKESQIKKIIADSDLARFMNHRERRMLDSYLASKDWERVMMVLDQVHKTVGDVQGFIPFAGGNSMGSTSNSFNGYYPSYTR